jgi:capsular exopolysaccharide synthesis family protein
MSDSASTFTIPIIIESDQQFRMAPGGPLLSFGQPFEIGQGSFIVNKTGVDHRPYSSNQFFINYKPLEDRAIEYVSRLTASESGESENIMKVSFQTENNKVGIEVVDQWMKEYQQAGLEEKKQIAKNALRFIDDQMDTIRQDLGSVEKNLQGFREKNKIYAPEQQSAEYFNNMSTVDNQITVKSLQLENVNFLIRYIGDDSNPYRQVASFLNVDEPSLVLQINNFNGLQVQRETLLKTTTTANPMVKNLESSIDKLRSDIVQNLENVKQSYQGYISSLRQKNAAASMEVSKIPVKEKELLDITRRQKILEELFSFLLQKKLETSISSASTISNVRVIESAIANGQPVMPNRKGTYLLALFLGLGIPVGIIFLKEFLNDKVKSRADIERATQAPVVGVVSHSDEKETLVVSRTSRRFIAEQFRIIRTNLEYILPKTGSQVILVTSSSSGDGKSFMSSNIGAVKALTGKRTVILEFDIRKPKIAGSLRVKHKTGISNYIIGKASFEDVVVPVPGVENLFMVPCGPIPPNPSELLLDDAIETLISRARKEFDVVVIDTAPLGLVSDPIILGKFADAAIFVIRHNHTYKKQLNMLNEIYISKRLPHLSIVVNDVKDDGGYGNYYGYGGYEYTGEGYGYGNDYFEQPANSKSRVTDLWRFLRFKRSK